jgi:hypothetical protein
MIVCDGEPKDGGVVMKRCPYCAEKMHEIAIVCPHCGRDYPHGAEDVSVSSTDRTVLPGRGVLILAGVLFMLLILSGWIFSIFKARDTSSDQARYSSIISQQKTMLAVSQAKFDTVSATLTSYQGTKDGTQPEQVAQMQATATIQAEQLSNQMILLREAKSREAKLCADFGKIDFDYSSNDTVLKQLDAYVAEIGGEVTKSTYILPWVGPNIALYSFKAGKYAFMFIGYFNLGEASYPNSIYWIDGICYLDIESP